MNKLLITAAFALSFGGFGIATANACAMKRLHVKAKPIMVVNSLKDAQRAEQKGHLRTAIRKYERAMNAKGDVKLKAEAAYSAARLHLVQGNAMRAQQRVTRALSFDSLHGNANAMKAKILAEAGDLKTARKHLRTAQANGADVSTVVAAEKAIDAASTTTALLQIGS